MRLENDKVFNELYDEEFNKIPFLFRFGQKRFKVSLVIMIVAFIGMCILTSVFFNTGRAEVIQAPISVLSTGSQMMVNTYEYGYLIAAIVCGLVAILFSLWMVISRQFERRAFRKATNLANMIFLSERHRTELKWQDWKMNNRACSGV